MSSHELNERRLVHAGARWPRARRGPSPVSNRDQGSVLLEVLIAFSLLAVVIMAADSGTMFSTAAASVAQQRSVASTLVSADVANASSIPFNDLSNGLNPNAETLSNDSNIQVVGSTYTLKLTGATLASSNTNTSETPLVPHISISTIRGVAYKVSTYPSSSSGIVTLVVIVTWTSALGGTAKLVGETQMAAP